LSVQQAKGLALQDIITEILPYALKINFPSQVQLKLVDKLAEME
jgi:hypothetical protein